MPGIGSTAFLALIIALGASLYQLVLKDFLTTTLGIGRVIQSIDEFPYTCRRIEHPRLEACEDIWLDDEARTLYAACAGTEGRLAWNQAMGNLNVTGRRVGGSELIGLDIDNPGPDGLFNMRGIKPVGHYKSATGTQELDLLGFDALLLDNDTVQFYFVNQRPPVADDHVMDASELGANSTVEIFDMKRGEDTMRHVGTILSEDISTPNRVAAIGDGTRAFLVTNDHSVKTGWRRQLDFFIGGGNVAYCDGKGTCHVAYRGDEKDQLSHLSAKDEPAYTSLINEVLGKLPHPKLKFPNGLTRGHDGLYYVPSTIDGCIRVFSLQPNKTLSLLHTIDVGMPLDNLSPDANGDIYAAAFPNLLQSGKGFADVYNETSPVTIWKIKKNVTKEHGLKALNYTIEKVIEDKEGKVLSGSTTVRHDIKTGRLFISAAVHPFLVVCEPQ